MADKTWRKARCAGVRKRMGIASADMERWSMTDGTGPRRHRTKKRQTGMNPMLHARAADRVLQTAVMAGEAMRWCRVKGMSDKGGICFPPYLRAWTQNGEMVYGEEKGAMSIRTGKAYIRQTKEQGNDRE